MPGTYEVYVNNYEEMDEESIDFIVLTYEDGEISTIDDSWGLERGFNHEDKLEAMMKMTTIEITQEMIDDIDSNVFVAM